MKVFKNGLATGLVLQLAIGPVFFFIINLALQKSIFDGLAGVLAVTIVDYFYITLAIFGIGKLLENKKVKKVFGIISSIVLIILGIFIIKGIADSDISTSAITSSTNLLSSFVSVFLLTISSPMTIVFFTSIFTTKALEYNYTKKELLIFGFGTGLATFLFIGTSVILFTLIKGGVPILLIQILNLVVGCLLIGYGGIRLLKVYRGKIYDAINRKYSLSEYDPNWISQFNSIKELLLNVFGDKALRIEHVGSTSVQGMKAKPLIDILMVVEKLELFEKEKELMTKAGYAWQYYPDPEGLTFSKFGPDNEKNEGIHICEESSLWVRQFIVVRDYLRTHPEKAKEYSKLKQKIIEMYPNDYPAYRKAKAPFLEQLKKESYSWEEGKSKNKHN